MDVASAISELHRQVCARKSYCVVGRRRRPRPRSLRESEKSGKVATYIALVGE